MSNETETLTARIAELELENLALKSQLFVCEKLTVKRSADSLHRLMAVVLAGKEYYDSATNDVNPATIYDYINVLENILGALTSDDIAFAESFRKD